MPPFIDTLIVKSKGLLNLRTLGSLLGGILCIGLLIYLAIPNETPTNRVIQKVETTTAASEAPPTTHTHTPPPLQRFAHQTVLKEQGPRLAIVLKDINSTPEAFIEEFDNISREVTLALKADSPLIELAHSMGFEILMDLPMEPSDYPYNDPGAQALLTVLTPQQNEERLKNYVKNDPPVVGFFPFMGEAFLKNKDALEHFIAWIGKKGYAFVDPTPQSNERNIMMGELARGYGAYVYINPVLIDMIADPQEMTHQQNFAELEAKRAGVSLGILSAYTASIALLKEWLPTLPEKKINLVSVSSIFFPPDVEDVPHAKKNTILPPTRGGNLDTSQQPAIKI